MVASLDGSRRLLPALDAHVKTMRTDTRVVFNPHDINAMAVWEVHTDSALSQKGLLAAARSGPLDFDEWAAVHAHKLDPTDSCEAPSHQSQV